MDTLTMENIINTTISNDELFKKYSDASIDPKKLIFTVLNPSKLPVELQKELLIHNDSIIIPILKSLDIYDLTEVKNKLNDININSFDSNQTSMQVLDIQKLSDKTKDQLIVNNRKAIIASSVYSAKLNL